MEKHEAIELIMNRWEEGSSQEEIVALLSEELNAPQDYVERFVSRLIANLPPRANPVQASTMEQSSSSPAQLTGHETRKLSSDPNEWQSVNEQPPSPPLASPKKDDEQVKRISLQTSSESSETAQSNVNSGNTGQAQISQDAILEDLILKALTKNRRQDDIVMKVCERTGMTWDQAQRLVAQVAANNRKKLTSDQNKIFIPISIIVILGGFTLVLASASEMLALVRSFLAFQSGATTILPEVDITVRGAPIAFITGLGLALGGFVGLVRSVQSQFD